MYIEMGINPSYFKTSSCWGWGVVLARVAPFGLVDRWKRRGPATAEIAVVTVVTGWQQRWRACCIANATKNSRCGYATTIPPASDSMRATLTLTPTMPPTQLQAWHPDDLGNHEDDDIMSTAATATREQHTDETMTSMTQRTTAMAAAATIPARRTTATVMVTGRWGGCRRLRRRY
ncbi:hypothetical protein EI94DRAFT_1792696 [Lactarius quietus]|nr:hypothetical protein EI94DRAFT_1792696 [Lactarius quietus]